MGVRPAATGGWPRLLVVHLSHAVPTECGLIRASKLRRRQHSASELGGCGGHPLGAKPDSQDPEPSGGVRLNHTRLSRIRAHVLSTTYTRERSQF